MVVGQMALCCALVITTGLLVQSVRSASLTSVGRRLGTPILATLQSRSTASRHESASSGLTFFRRVQDAASSVPGITPRAWVSTPPGGLPAWRRFRIERSGLAVRDVSMDVALFTSASLARITMPPTAGRLFGGEDAPQACRVAIVNEAAEREAFDGPAVGHSIDNPTGQRVEIVGVVAPRRTIGDAAPSRPTIHDYANQIGTPSARSGAATFRVPVRADASTAVLEANVVSAGYFEAIGWSMKEGRALADD